MIRVMIVEDEPPIAMGLKRIIESKESFFDVVNVAMNGKRAIEYLEENDVDLIFTDIQMPIMNGLELVEHIAKFKPKVSTIIISGYQDFNYAQRALKSDVMDYILKPISKAEVFKVLDEYKEKYDKSSKKDKRMLLEEKFSNTKNSTDLNSQDIEIEFKDSEKYGVCICCFGNIPLTVDAIDLNNMNVPSNEEIEKEVSKINQSGNCMCVYGKNITEKIILFPAKDINAVKDTAEKVFDYLASSSDKHLTFITHNTLSSMNNMRSVFRTIRSELYSESSLYVSKFLLYGQKKISNEIDSSINLEIVKALTSRDKASIERAFETFVEKAMEASMRQKDFMVFLEKNILHIYDKHLELSQLVEVKQQLELSVTTAANPKQLTKEVTEVLYFWLNPNMQTLSSNETLESIASYIKNHHKENISLSVLAKEFGMSAASLSKKFKSYYNLSIPEYVNKYRIELAIGLMNYDENKMIKEISLEVGYNDQYYFSKTFKKIVGVWPTEYLNKKENDNEKSF